jgi:glyoxylase-like metal-dependent hydrolase (beta-lactamase superfamily II)
MNSLELQLIYPMGDHLPPGGSKTEVAPNIFWVRMPLPFALDHINLYLVREQLDGQEGWTLIDCGVATDEIRAHWETIFTNHLDGLPILRVICTHMHPDHIGLSAWITNRFDCSFWMTMGEYALGRVLSSEQPANDTSNTVDHYRRHGVTDLAALQQLHERGSKYFRSLVPGMPTRFRRMREDETVHMAGADWQIIIGTGHSPEHAALYCAERQLLLSGDMVLPRISTNVSVFELEQEANPLEWFLRSIAKYYNCDADTLVLPSHGKPFKNLHVRIKQLEDHHRDRLAEVIQACTTKECCAMDIVPIMFKRPLDLHQTTFAMGEALAHLHALWFRGELQRVVDQGGVVRFKLAKSPKAMAA